MPQRQRQAVPLVGLDAGDALAAPATSYSCFASANDSRAPSIGKKSKRAGAQQRRPRRSQGEQAGVVDAFADEAEDVLLRVGVGVGLDAVAHPPRQRGDVAADGGRGHARVEGGDVGRERAAAGVADAADPLRVDLRQRRQVVDGPHAVPDAVAGQARAEQVERVAEHGMFAAGQVEARLALRRVPELAPLALADRIVGQHDVAALGQVDVQDLVRVGRLADRRMAAGADDAGPLSLDVLGPVEQRRHEVARKALEHQLFDAIVVGLDLPQVSHARRLGRLGQPAEQPQERLAQGALEGSQILWRLHGGKAGPALTLLLAGQGQQLLVHVHRFRLRRKPSRGQAATPRPLKPSCNSWRRFTGCSC